MKRQVLSRWVPGLVGMGVLLTACGCGFSVAGRWEAVECKPNREMFCIDDATFRKDGTYAAETTIDGKTALETGTYEFNGFKLTLHPEAGGRRSFYAHERFGRLRVSDDERHVILKKVK